MISKNIFLSSRFEEFKEIRKKLTDKIHLYDNINAINLDNNEPSDGSALEISLKWAREADLMILIIGETYGDAPTGYHESYTHLEYIEAKKHKTPIFIYFIGESYKKNGQPVIVNSDNKKLREWQEKIQKEHRASVYSNIDDLNFIVDNILAKITNEVVRKIETGGKTVEFSDGLERTNDLTLLCSKYHNDVIRRTVYSEIKDEIYTLKLGGWCHYYGPTGIGKSSFLANTSQMLWKDGIKNIIYFIESNSNTKIDNYLILDGIYNLLIRYFEQYALDYDLKLRQQLRMIPQDFLLHKKIDTLKHYVKESKYFIDSPSPFIICIDGFNQAADPLSLFRDIIGKQSEFIYITTSQHYIDPKLANTIRLSIDGFKIPFLDEDKMGKQLLPLDKNSASAYLHNEFDLKVNLDGADKESLVLLLLEQSKGLPIYMKLASNAICIQIKNNASISYIKNYILTLPDDLGLVYFNEFKSIHDDFPDALQILNILFWFQSPISINRLQSLSSLAYELIERIIIRIQHLLIQDSHGIKLYHQSLAEALFEYSIDNGIKGCNITQEQISKWTAHWPRHEQTIFLCSNGVKTLKELKIYHPNNELYKILQDIIKKMTDQVSSETQDVQIYYDFIITRYFLVPKYIQNISECDIDTIFTSKNDDPEFQYIIIKILSLYISKPIDSIFTAGKLFAISLFSNDAFTQAAFLRLFWKVLYSSQYKKIIDKKILEADSYEVIESRLGANYLIYNTLLDGEFDNKLFVELDGLNVYVTRGLNENLYDDLYYEALRIHRQKRKTKSLIERLKTISKYIEGSRDVKLIKFFIDSLSNNSLSIKAQDEFEKQTLYNMYMEVLSIELLDGIVDDKFYAKAPNDFKFKLSSLQNIYTDYLNNGIEVVYNTEFLEYVPNFLNSHDKEIYFRWIIDNDFSDLKLRSLLTKLAYSSIDNKNLLSNIYSELLKINLKLKIFDTPILMKIATFLNDKKQLKKLEIQVIDADIRGEEKSIITRMTKLVNDPDNIENVFIESKHCEKEILEAWIKKGRLTPKVLEIFIKNHSSNNYTELFNSALIYLPFEHSKVIFENFLLKENPKFAKFFSLRYFLEKKHIKSNYISKEDVVLLLKSQKYDVDLNQEFWEMIIKMISKLPTSNNYNDRELLNLVLKYSGMRKFIIDNPVIIKQIYEQFSKYRNCDDNSYIMYQQFRRYFAMTLSNGDLLEFVKTMQPNTPYMNIIIWYGIERCEDSKIRHQLSKYLDENRKYQFLIYNAIENNDFNELDNLLTEYLDIADINDDFVEYIVKTIFEKMKISEQTILNLLSKNGSNLKFSKYLNACSFEQNIEIMIDKNGIGEFNKRSGEDLDEIKKIPNGNILKIINILEKNISSISHFVNVYFKDFILQSNVVMEKSNNSLNLLFQLFRLYTLYKNSEEQDDENNYNMLSSSIMNIIDQMKSDENFKWLDCVNPDTLFESFSPFEFSLLKKDRLDVKLISDDYIRFYHELVYLYEAWKVGGDEQRQKIELEFSLLRDDIINNEENFTILQDLSQIKNKLQIKLSNIHLFKPND